MTLASIATARARRHDDPVSKAARAVPGERRATADPDVSPTVPDDSVYVRFFRDAPDAVVVVDAAGSIIEANDQVTVLFGYEVAELLGEQMDVLVPDRFRPHHDELCAAYMTGPSTRLMGTDLELWGKRRDGSEFPVNVSLTPATTEQGFVVLAAIRDVTPRRAAERAARQWAEVFERAAWGVVLSSHDWTRLDQMNQAFAQMHGYTVEELTGRPMLDVFAPEAWDDLAEHLATVQATGHDSFESVHVRRDGTRFPVLIDATVIRDESGSVRYRAAHVTDISEQKEAEQALRQSESRFRRVFEDAPFGIALVDDELRITQANDALSTMLGYDPEALTERTLGDLTPDEDVRRVDQLARRLFTGELERFTIEKRLLTARGRIVWAELHVSPLEGEAPARAVVMAVDVTSRKQLEAELTHRATHDPLTGLPNRTLFEDRLHVAQARTGRSGEPFGILFIDLNGFKAINDQFGHARGDLVLVEIAHRIAGAVRPADTVARIGGDEFVVLCEGLGAEEAAARHAAVDVGQRVLDSLRPEIDLDADTATITAAIGIVVTGEPRGSPTALLAAADAAMYLAKATPGESIAVADEGPATAGPRR